MLRSADAKAKLSAQRSWAVRGGDINVDRGRVVTHADGIETRRLPSPPRLEQTILTTGLDCLRSREDPRVAPYISGTAEDDSIGTAVKGRRLSLKVTKGEALNLNAIDPAA